MNAFSDAESLLRTVKGRNVQGDSSDVAPAIRKATKETFLTVAAVAEVEWFRSPDDQSRSSLRSAIVITAFVRRLGQPTEVEELIRRLFRGRLPEEVSLEVAYFAAPDIRKFFPEISRIDKVRNGRDKSAGFYAFSRLGLDWPPKSAAERCSMARNFIRSYPCDEFDYELWPEGESPKEEAALAERALNAPPDAVLGFPDLLAELDLSAFSDETGDGLQEESALPGQIIEMVLLRRNLRDPELVRTVFLRMAENPVLDHFVVRLLYLIRVDTQPISDWIASRREEAKSWPQVPRMAFDSLAKNYAD